MSVKLIDPTADEHMDARMRQFLGIYVLAAWQMTQSGDDNAVLGVTTVFSHWFKMLITSLYLARTDGHKQRYLLCSEGQATRNNNSLLN